MDLIKYRQAVPLNKSIASFFQAKDEVFGRQTSYVIPQKRVGKSRRNIFKNGQDSQRPKSSFCSNIITILLIFYSLFLVYKAAIQNQASNSANVPLWDLQNSQQLLALIGSLVLKSFCKFAYFVPVGFMATIVIAFNLSRSRLFRVGLLGILAASILAILVQAIENDWTWHLSTVLDLILPLIGCLFGTWIGTTWLRGRRARLWLLPKVVGLILLIAFCAGMIIKLSVQEMTLPFEPAKVTSAEKRRLAYLVRSKSPRSLIEGQTHTLRLTEDDINILLSWGLSLGSPNRKAIIDLEPDSTSLAASINIIPDGRKKRYLNLMVAGYPVIKQGILTLKINQLRLGDLEIPQLLLKIFSPVVTSILSNDHRSKPFLDATKAIAIDQNSIEVTYGPLNLRYPGFREDLFGRATAGVEVLNSTRAQVENLLTVVSQLPDAQPDFGKCFETVFTLARERSIDGNPITENRAGIFAIGILIGHPRVEEFIGPVHAGRDKYAARRALSQVELRGRSDWTKHFCVAAAITLLSEDVISHAASLLKEEIDAGRAGSGFSFSDLLAGEAGTTFALHATRDEATARAMQERIVGGFRVEEFFPPAADLPEEIPDAELQSIYGGVGGEGYNRLIEEIEQRISFCAAYLSLQ